MRRELFFLSFKKATQREVTVLCGDDLIVHVINDGTIQFNDEVAQLMVDRKPQLTMQLCAVYKNIIFMTITFYTMFPFQSHDVVLVVELLMMTRLLSVSFLSDVSKERQQCFSLPPPLFFTKVFSYCTT